MDTSFHIDCPRMDIWIDDVHQNSGSGRFHETLAKVLPSELLDSVTDACCQEFLVPWTQEGKYLFASGKEEHFLDGGRQTVFIDTTKENTTVFIYKPFKTLSLKNDEEKITNHVLLSLSVEFRNATDGESEVLTKKDRRWIQNGPSTQEVADWELVESKPERERYSYFVYLFTNTK